MCERIATKNTVRLYKVIKEKKNYQREKKYKVKIHCKEEKKKEKKKYKNKNYKGEKKEYSKASPAQHETVTCMAVPSCMIMQLLLCYHAV